MKTFWSRAGIKPGDGIKVAVSSKEAFERFKANPAGINNDSQLGQVFRGIENMQDGRERLIAARYFAFEIVSLVNSAPEEQRQEITRALGSELMNSPFMEGVFAWVLGEIREENTKGRMRAETQSQEERRKVEQFKWVLRDSLKQAGLSDFGNFSIETNGDDVVRFRRKPDAGGGGVPPELRPLWYQDIKWLAKWTAIAVAVAGALCFGASFVIRTPSVARDGSQNIVFENPSQEKITPDDPLVMEAVVRSTPKGPLSFDQIFGAYDFVTDHVEYRYVSHKVIPRYPKQTLEPILKNCKSKNFRKCITTADCKTMSVLLASMLESFGAKTLLFSWYDPQEDKGHEYVGVLISEQQDNAKRAEEANGVMDRITERYRRRIALYRKGKVPDLQIVDVKIGDKWGAYLLLDATGGPRSIPGEAFRKIELEKIHESRPGVAGMLPEDKTQ